MKKIMLSILSVWIILQLSLTSCSDKATNTFTVKGEIEAYTDTLMNLTVWDPAVTGGTRSERILVKDGKFEYVGECSEPMMVRGWINDAKVIKRANRGYFPVKSSNIWFIIYPGAKVTIKGHLSDYAEAFPSDRGENKLLAGLNRQLFPILNEEVNIRVRMATDTTLSPEIRRELEAASGDLNRESIETLLTFLSDHPSSIAALWYMDDMLIRSQADPKELEQILDMADEKYHNTSYYKTVKTKIEGSKNTVVGCMVPEVISSDTPDGKTFDLKDLQGKYVIIDFWGTWCGACMQGMPAMREFRDKHIDQIELLGIANDRNRESWKKVIETSELNWYHIFNGVGEKNFVQIFNVQGFPTKILISPEGVILNRTSGEEESYYDEIEKIINTL